MEKQKSDLELRAERINYEGDLTLEHLKRFYNRKTIAEAYREGVCSLHMHVLSVRPYALEYFSGSALEATGLARRQGSFAFPFAFEEGQMSVLVWVRDGAQSLCPIDSFVRLVRLDSVYVRGRQACQVSWRESTKIVIGVADGELSSVLDLSLLIENSKLIDNVVESRSKVVNTVSNGQAETKRNFGKMLSTANDEVFRTRIVLDGQTIFILPTHTFDLRNNFPKVLVGAFDPFTSAVKGMINHG